VVQEPGTHDVIVIGAGPAGCRAALVLGRLERSVLLLDKARFPRWKPCAGGLTAKALPYIPEELRSQFQRTMRGAILTYGVGQVTHVTTSGELGWTVHRESFDRAHLDLVRSLAGVEVREGCAVRQVVESAERVVVRAGDTRWSAPVVIGADGVNSVVSRQLPGHADRLIGMAYEGEAAFTDPALHGDVLFDFRKFPGGYGWVFPKRDHYSVGGYAHDGDVRRVARLYDEFCAETPQLTSCTTYRRRGYRIPQGGLPRKLNTNRLLLSGDAADLVDPLTGEGVYYALRSGQLAAEAVDAYLRRGKPLDGYSARIREEIQEEFRVARGMAAILFRDRGAAFHLLLKNRTVCRWCVEILTGRKTYRELRRDILRRGWLLPLQFRPFRRQRVHLEIAGKAGGDLARAAKGSRRRAD